MRPSGQVRISSSGDALAVIVPRLWAGRLGQADSPVFDTFRWQGMSVSLPHGEWLNVITGEKILIDGDRNRLSDFMGTIPFAVLRQAGGKGDPG
jgi:maltooligosyltrehalose synthase